VSPEGPTSRLAHFVGELTPQAVPEEVMHEARRALVDHLGVAVAGAAEKVTRRARDAVGSYDAGVSATVVGSPMRASAPGAAFLNAFSAHVLDLDDVYNPPGTTVHGSCSVWPAVLAVADTRTITGKQALTAFVGGFEVETRVAHAAGQAHYDVGWHVTGTSGHVGAAAAAALAMGLGGDEVEHAIAAGATQASGLRVMAGSDLKSMHPGKAAMDGVLAATLAGHGLATSARVLEGDFGYLQVLSSQPWIGGLEHELGDTWNLAANGYKLYPSGSLTHPAVDGVLDLMLGERASAGDVTGIALRVAPPAARFTDLTDPRTPLQAKFSLRHCAAAAAVFGTLGVEELGDAALAHPEVQRLRELVTVTVEPDLGKQDADVELALAEQRLRREVRGNRGTPSAPLSDSDLGTKFLQLVAPRLGADRAHELLDTCWHVDDLEDASTLLARTTGGQ
jgi:2-methylcitrate dehydratase PrpD